MRRYLRRAAMLLLALLLLALSLMWLMPDTASGTAHIHVHLSERVASATSSEESAIAAACWAEVTRGRSWASRVHFHRTALYHCAPGDPYAMLTWQLTHTRLPTSDIADFAEVRRQFAALYFRRAAARAGLDPEDRANRSGTATLWVDVPETGEPLNHERAESVARQLWADMTRGQPWQARTSLVALEPEAEKPRRFSYQVSYHGLTEQEYLAIERLRGQLRHALVTKLSEGPAAGAGE